MISFAYPKLARHSPFSLSNIFRYKITFILDVTSFLSPLFYQLPFVLPAEVRIGKREFKGYRWIKNSN